MTASLTGLAPRMPADAVAAPPGAVVTCALTRDEASAARTLARQCATEYGRVDSAAFLADVGLITHDLPRRVRAAVRQVRLDDTAHAVVLSGNHAGGDALEPTPESWRDADTPGSRLHAFWLMLYGALVGEPVSWSSQQDGRLITDVVPTAGMENSLISCSSLAELGWHTEDAFSPARADYIGLFSLRNPRGIPTTVTYLAPGALDPDLLAVLRQPRFLIRPDDAHDPARTHASTGPVPLITGHEQAPVLRVDRDFTDVAAGDLEAAEALSALVDCLDASTYDLVLRPGEVCFLDNRTVAHGRRPFRARYDGRDRWLKRVNIVEDLRRTSAWRADLACRVIGRH